MTWFRVDDKSAFHSKVIACGDASWGLLCRAGAWSSGQGTDGFIPSHMAKLLCATEARWKALVSAGLVSSENDGYRIHDFLQWNPSAAEVNAKLESRRELGRTGASSRWNGKRKVIGAGGDTVDYAVRHAGGIGHGIDGDNAKDDSGQHLHGNAPSRPNPTQPFKISEFAEVALPAPKPRKTRPKAEPHPRFREVVDAYATAFEGARGSKPTFDAKDGRHINQLLGRFGGDADKAIALIRGAYAGDQFKARNATIATIAADPSKYVGSSMLPPKASAHYRIGVQPSAEAFGDGGYEATNTGSTHSSEDS